MSSSSEDRTNPQCSSSPPSFHNSSFPMALVIVVTFRARLRLPEVLYRSCPQWSKVSVFRQLRCASSNVNCEEPGHWRTLIKRTLEDTGKLFVDAAKKVL